MKVLHDVNTNLGYLEDEDHLHNCIDDFLSLKNIVECGRGFGYKVTKENKKDKERIQEISNDIKENNAAYTVHLRKSRDFEHKVDPYLYDCGVAVLTQHKRNNTTFYKVYRLKFKKEGETIDEWKKR